MQDHRTSSYPPKSNTTPAKKVVGRQSFWEGPLSGGKLLVLGRVYIYIYIYIYIPESSKGVKFEPLNHQKQTQGLKFDTLGGFRYI